MSSSVQANEFHISEWQDASSGWGTQAGSHFAVPKGYLDLIEQDLQTQISNIIENTDPVALNSLKEIAQAFEEASGGVATFVNEKVTLLEAADATLQDNIDAEEQARIAQDTVHTGLLDGLRSDLTTEQEDRESADSALQDNIDTEEASRIAAVNAEATARSNADSALQANIDAEEAARITKDDILQGNIDAEATARSNADSALQANIDAEEAARITKDDILQGNIDAEATARSDADTALQDNIDTEEASRIAAVNAEATARSNADSALQANIDAEEAARITKDDILQGNIDAEATARSNADSALQANIDAEEAARITKDDILQGNIDAEATARSDADTALQDNIDTEEASRIAAVNAEATARSNADSALQANIDAEEAARITKDDILQGNIEDLRDDMDASFSQVYTILQVNTKADSDLRKILGGTDQTLEAGKLAQFMGLDPDKVSGLTEGVITNSFNKNLGASSLSRDKVYQSFKLAENKFITWEKDAQNNFILVTHDLSTSQVKRNIVFRFNTGLDE